MKNVLVTGASSGIGSSVCELLIKKSFTVWGVARREVLLKKLKSKLGKNFLYSNADVSTKFFWKKLIKEMDKTGFIPQVIIFNAGLHKNDLKSGIDTKTLRDMMETNFFSIIEGVNEISARFGDNMHYITISSTSALKANYEEGIGYATSKASLSLAFESLFQKYLGSKTHFSTVFLGPVATDMTRFSKAPPFMLFPDKVAEHIFNVIQTKKSFVYYPGIIFAIISIMRLLPKKLFFKIWIKMQKPYNR